MTFPQPEGPVVLKTFYAGDLPSTGSPVIWTNPDPMVTSVVTVIDVFYNGSGSDALITFAINSEDPFWASSPVSGSIHTEQYRGLIVLAGQDYLRATAQYTEFSINVSGFMINRFEF